MAAAGRFVRANLPGVSSVIDAAKRLLRAANARHVRPTQHDMLKQIQKDLATVRTLDSNTDEEVRTIDICVEQIATVLGQNHEAEENAMPPPPELSIPPAEISVGDIQEYLNLGLTLQAIADKMNCHHQTLRALLRKEGKTIRGLKYSRISDEDLTALIREYNRDHENAGIISVLGWLKSRGVCVQRQRCRDILRNVDPQGAAIRRASTIRRRQYSVDSANAWWHVDAHCSLDKWGIWVQGGIDGFSRKVVFLRATSSNSKKAAACHFIEGVLDCGVPGRTRTDHGSENHDIKAFVERVNGAARGSCVQGPSTANERIERLWRDVFSKAICSFYNLFLHMEENEVLKRDNEIHLFCLHYVFLPRIDAFLQDWKNGWNNRRSRALRGLSPDTTWKLDLEEKVQTRPQLTVALSNVVYPPVEGVQNAKTELDIPDNTGQFLLPRFANPLDQDAQERLRQSVNVLQHSDSLGMDIYIEVSRFVQRELRN